MTSEIFGNPLSQSPSKMNPDYKSLVEQFIAPVVIFNRQGKPCFVNLAARQLLAGGMAARLMAHLYNESSRRAVTQVRFPLDAGGTIVLKISRVHIEWEGQPAVLVTLQNVTAYIDALQESQSSSESLSRQLAADCEDLKEQLHQAINVGRTAEKECEQLRQNLRESGQAGEALKIEIANLEAQLEERTAESESAMERIRQEISKVGFWKNSARRELLTKRLVRDLDSAGLCPAGQERELAQQLVALAKENHEYLTAK